MTPESPRDPKLDKVEPALDQLGQLLQRLVEQGWQRATKHTASEITTIAQVAHHARLVWIERELSRLGTQLERYLNRDPSFSAVGLLATVNRLWLSEATVRAALGDARTVRDLEAVAGIPRRTYVPQDQMIDIVAVGARGWVTDSGFVGVTAHVWQRETGRWLEASLARPDRVVADPGRLYGMSLSDATPITMREFCHGAWTLDDVRISADGRISLHRELVVVPTAIPPRQALATVAAKHLGEVVDRLEAEPSGPLDGPAQALIYMDGVSIERPLIDDTHAVVRSAVRDRSGNRFDVSIPLRAEHDTLVDNLELCSTPAWTPDGLLAEAMVRGDGVALAPISAVFSRPLNLSRRVKSTHLVHLTVDPLKRAKR